MKIDIIWVNLTLLISSSLIKKLPKVMLKMSIFLAVIAHAKNRTCISYDNIIVIVLLLVWLIFLSLYPIVKVYGKVIQKSIRPA